MKIRLHRTRLAALSATIILLATVAGFVLSAQLFASIPNTGGSAVNEPAAPVNLSSATFIGPDYSAWTEQERALYQITEAYDVPASDLSRMTEQERAQYQITDPMP